VNRSELIFRAEANIPNRLLLVKVVAKAARTIHVPGTRIGKTINDVLAIAATQGLIAREELGPVAILPDAEEFLPQSPQEKLPDLVPFEEDGLWRYWMTEPRTGRRCKMGPFHQDDVDYYIEKAQSLP
jgi:hypothetical protein